MKKIARSAESPTHSIKELAHDLLVLVPRCVIRMEYTNDFDTVTFTSELGFEKRLSTVLVFVHRVRKVYMLP